MRIIIAPAKQMKEDTDTLPCTELPVFIDKAEQLKNYVNSLSYDEQKKLWACSDKIAQENRERFAEMDLRKRLMPAILAYDGIQYTYMAPDVFEQRYFDYVQEHVRILSGFYGSVRPLDKISAAAGQVHHRRFRRAAKRQGRAEGRLRKNGKRRNGSLCR